ncbi:MAG: hypothetical protein U1F67_19385 [Rubrivivax sp.]
MGWYVALLSWSLALVLSVIVAVTLTLAASIVADLRRMAGGRRYADAKKDEGNGFGLCRGWSAGRQARRRPGPDGPCTWPSRRWRTGTPSTTRR